LDNYSSTNGHRPPVFVSNNQSRYI